MLEKSDGDEKDKLTNMLDDGNSHVKQLETTVDAAKARLQDEISQVELED